MIRINCQDRAGRLSLTNKNIIRIDTSTERSYGEMCTVTLGYFNSKKVCRFLIRLGSLPTRGCREKYDDCVSHSLETTRKKTGNFPVSAKTLSKERPKTDKENWVTESANATYVSSLLTLRIETPGNSLSFAQGVNLYSINFLKRKHAKLNSLS